MEKFSASQKKLIVFGSAVCVVTILLTSVGSGEHERLAVSAETDTVQNDGDDEVICDPFGYFNGRWNLWEYIGDSISSLFG